MSFVNAMNNPHTKNGVKGSDVYTEAGVGDLRVTLFQQLVRGVKSTEIKDTIHKAFTNPSSTKDELMDYAVMAFQTRDIRGGKGERDAFYSMLLSLFDEKLASITPLISLIPEYGCWVDLWKLYDISDTYLCAIQFKKAIVDFVKNTYFEDLEKLSQKQNISLLGKWLPREKSKFHSLAVVFSNTFHEDIVSLKGRMRQYRKNCALLNKSLNTTEVLMCRRTWADINPDYVPGRLMSISRKAFLNEIISRKGKPRKDTLRFPDNEDRMLCRQHFLDHTQKALNGDIKVKGAEVLFPHELVKNILSSESKYEENLIQAQWNAICEKSKETAIGLKSCVPLCDFSGSMRGIPMLVSIALGLLISEVNHPAFKGYILGFDSTPSWIRVGDKDSLREKVKYVEMFAKGLSTNFQAACELILTRLVENKVPAEEAPKDLIVFTDMGFDQASGNSKYNNKTKPWETHIQMIRTNFAKHGYTPPRIVLWNLRAEYKDYHAKADEEGVVVLSGWSPALLKALSNGIAVKTPYEGLREVLDNVRYDRVREAWRNSDMT